MKNRVQFSVVLCNYNYAQYVEGAIQSVLRQSIREFELIVVDDGSTDESVEKIKKFRDPRLALICQSNQGQGAAFNAGVANCQGEYVAFLDSDDYWYPNKLEVALTAIKGDGISLVQHNMDIVDGEGLKINRIHPGFRPGRLSIEDTYLKCNHTGFFCPSSSIVCRKSDLHEIFPIKGNWKICADVAITRPLPLFGDIVTLPQVLGAYRVHGQNTWINSPEQARWLDNHQRYTDYANHWLTNFGYEQVLDFSKSALYTEYKDRQQSKTKFEFMARTAIRRLRGRISQVVKLITGMHRS